MAREYDHDVGVVYLILVNIVIFMLRSDGVEALKTQPLDEPHAMQSMCEKAAFPATCMRELSPILPETVRPSGTSTNACQYVVGLSLRAAQSRAAGAMKLAARYSSAPHLKLLASQSAADCVELMGLTQDHLQEVVALLSQLEADSSQSSVSSLFAEIKLHLSSSLSYQSACYDGLQDTDTGASKSSAVQGQPLQGNQEYLFQVIGNVLTLVEQLQLQYAANGWLNDSASTEVSAPSTLSSGSDDGIMSSISSKSHLISRFIKADELPDWLSPVDREQLLLESNIAPAPAEPPNVNEVVANAVVAQDGCGDFLTITSALLSIPPDFQGRFVVYIKAGVYEESFNITRDQRDVTLLGDGMDHTIITGSKNVSSGYFTTFRSSTVGISGNGFFARDITFRNTAGPRGHQAVALRANADRLVFYRCRVEGFQDTLYALSGRQFYRDCEISGTVDFIFGYAIAIFQNCKLLARLPMHGQKNTYTAQGRKLVSDVNGFVFHNCTVAGEDALVNAPFPVSNYLGRPWKQFSRVIFLQSQMDALVEPQGWLPWNESNPFITTLFYGEFKNRGAGSPIERRVGWPGVHANMSSDEAEAFILDRFLQGSTWIPTVLDPIDFFSSLL